MLQISKKRYFILISNKSLKFDKFELQDTGPEEIIDVKKIKIRSTFVNDVDSQQTPFSNLLVVLNSRTSTTKNYLTSDLTKEIEVFTKNLNV